MGTSLFKEVQWARAIEIKLLCPKVDILYYGHFLQKVIFLLSIIVLYYIELWVVSWGLQFATRNKSRVFESDNISVGPILHMLCLPYFKTSLKCVIFSKNITENLDNQICFKGQHNFVENFIWTHDSYTCNKDTYKDYNFVWDS